MRSNHPRTARVSRPLSVLLTLALVAGLLASGPAKAWAGAVPGMRPNYVFSFMGAKTNASMLRMGTAVFHGDGTVTEEYWEWHQEWAPSTRNVYKYRTNTGYSTGGCGTVACQVWTASSFNGKGATRTGVWKFRNSGTRVQINFGAKLQYYELYALASYGTYTRLTLISANYPGFTYFFGAAYGSRASLSQGATLAQIKAVGSPTQNGINYTNITANWNMSLTRQSSSQWWNSPGNYTLCSSTCMKGAAPSKWHSYIVADPPNLGRKMYWFHQLASVAKSTTCANAVYGGHTVQLLQIIDDNGTFIGMLGGEASIMARYPGGSIIGYYVGFKF